MSFEEKDMPNICIISANDGSEWGQFLSKEIQDLGNVIQYVVDTDYAIPWMKMNEDVTCIILSPGMLESNKEFIQKSNNYISNPIIVLCGVPLRVMSQVACCKLWKECRVLTVNSSEESADNFYRSVTLRLIEQTTSPAVTLVPETVLQKANQSCVLIFSRALSGKVEVLIQGNPNKLTAKQTDTKTFIFNVPELAEGSHQLKVFVSNQVSPTKLSLDVMNPKSGKCSCDYILQILHSEDFQPLDNVLRTAMENDYSNRLFYQHICKRNPDFPEFPTPLHFAAKHGLCNVLKHLLSLPGSEGGPGIKNDEDKDCLDIAKDTKYSSTLVPVLQAYCDEDNYMDMTRNSNTKLNDQRKRHSIDDKTVKLP